MSNMRYNYTDMKENGEVSGTGWKSRHFAYSAIAVSLLIILLGWSFVKAVNKHIENQDTMLCESALKSGNKEYLKKCECYYQTNNIKCLQEGR